jgi:Sulfotransferase family
LEAPKNKLLFVVGLWRSGTTLLQVLLNQHSQIALMFEVQPFALWPRNADALLPENWQQRLDLFNRAISRHHLDADSLPVRTSGREALLAIFNETAKRQNAVIMGGKSPAYHQWLPEIADIFPEASFLIIWRDPVECCRSAAKLKRTLLFFRKPGMMTRTLFGMEVLAKGVEQLRREKRRVHEIVYGELVGQPEIEVRRICEFLEIEFEPQMLDLKTANFSGVPDGEALALIRSGAIKRRENHEEFLSADFLAKIGRYKTLWSEHYASQVFARALTSKTAEGKPGTMERLFDRSAYAYWKGVDYTKRVIQRHIPLALWRWWRGKTHAESGLNKNPDKTDDATTK